MNKYNLKLFKCWFYLFEQDSSFLEAEWRTINNKEEKKMNFHRSWNWNVLCDRYISISDEDCTPY
jgi:hypothetical protein